MSTEILPEERLIPLARKDTYMPVPRNVFARITQWWGENPKNYWGLGHNGLDIGLVEGTPLVAMTDGVVKYVGHDMGGYGVYVRILYPDMQWLSYTKQRMSGKSVQSFYAHLSRTFVRIGERVKAGQVVALSGNTGRSTGPHLHWEIRLSDAYGKYAEGFGGWGRGRRPVERFLTAMQLGLVR